MKNVISVMGILPLATLAAASTALAAIIPHWALGDDETAMRTLANDLAFDVAVIEADPSRSDMMKIATNRVRSISARYRRAADSNAIDDHGVDDWALARPDDYPEFVADRMALAA